MSSLSQLSDSVAAEEEGQVVGRTLLKACSTRACPAKTAGRGGVRERSSNRYLSRVATCAAQIVRLLSLLGFWRLRLGCSAGCLYWHTWRHSLCSTICGCKWPTARRTCAFFGLNTGLCCGHLNGCDGPSKEHGLVCVTRPAPTLSAACD